MTEFVLMTPKKKTTAERAPPILNDCVIETVQTENTFIEDEHLVSPDYERFEDELEKAAALDDELVSPIDNIELNYSDDSDVKKKRLNTPQDKTRESDSVQVMENNGAALSGSVSASSVVQLPVLATTVKESAGSNTLSLPISDVPTLNTGKPTLVLTNRKFSNPFASTLWVRPPSQPQRATPNLAAAVATDEGVASVGATTGIDPKFKCAICNGTLHDPRVMDCLHTFCFVCLVELEGGNSFWQTTLDVSDTEMGSNRNDPPLSSSASAMSGCDSDPTSKESSTPERERRPSQPGFRARKLFRGGTAGKEMAASGALSKMFTEVNSSTLPPVDRPKTILCPVCQTASKIPIGGAGRFPKNYVLGRKLERELLRVNDQTALCNLCTTRIQASSFCVSCEIYLCSFCETAHSRQRTTSRHEMRSTISDTTSHSLKESSQKTLKCLIHSGHDVKLFCTGCNQVVCNECTILLHRGHKCEVLGKASKHYMRTIKSSLDQTRPLADYATLTISKLAGITQKIDIKCNAVQNDVDGFLVEYLEALEVHRKTLIHQIARTRENKLELIFSQKADLEKRSGEARTAVQFAEDLLAEASDVEILSFAGILLRRFTHCQKSKTEIDPKISDSLQFLPEVQAPSTKAQNFIPMFGIITTQTAVPKFCTLESTGLMNLRVNKKAELVVIARDNNDQRLCHGGLVLIVELKYRDSTGRALPVMVGDRRDGTYVVSFVPDTPGPMILVIAIKTKPIKGSPFNLCARTLRPHAGIYQCCTFCASGGSKALTCACGGVMPGYKGCGHGHEGHPGRRHWSCCGNVLENSECSKANA